MPKADFAHFYDVKLDVARTADDAALIQKLLEIGGGQRVLDAGCGYGRISWSLARMGIDVTGVDINPMLIQQARGIRSSEETDTPEFVVSDLRHFIPRDPYDVIISWYSSFGFDDDPANLAMLRRFRDWLQPRGTLLIDLVSRDYLVRNYKEWIALENGADTLIDHNEFDPATGVSHIRRRVYVQGSLAEETMHMRVYTYSEIRVLLERCGFIDVAVCGRDAQPLTLDSNRMVITCQRPG